MSGTDTTSDGEWTGWRDAWAAEEATPVPGAAATGPRRAAAARAGGEGLADLLRRLHRQRLRMLAVAAGEALALVALIGFTVAIVHGGAVAWQVVWLVTLWVFACVAATFAWWNRRATWRAAGASVEDAVQLARLRAERQLRTVTFVLLLYAAEAAAVAAQLAWFGRLVPLALLALAAMGLAIAAWGLMTRRRLRRELARIDAFVRETHVALEP